MRAVCLATIAAIVVQPLVFALYFLLPPILVGQAPSIRDVLDMITLVMVFAAAFVFVLGLPIFFGLRYFKRDGWWSLGTAGFLAGAMPVSVLVWPYGPSNSSYSGDWHGHYVDFIVNGIPTLYGWLDYAQGAFLWGLHGLVGALSFYFVWRRYSRIEEARRA